MKVTRSRIEGRLLETLESRVLLSVTPLVQYRPASTQPGAEIHVASLLFNGVGGKPASGSTTIAAPTNVSATAASTNQISLRWTGSSGATGYYIYRSADGATYSKIASAGSSATSYADTTVKAASTYYYYLVAYKKTTLSAKSAVVSATTPSVTVPSAPTGLAVNGYTTSSISLGWTDAASNESGYRVYRSADGSTYSLIASLAAGSTAYTDAGLASGTQFYYEVGAWNSAGEGLAGPVSGTTTSVVPSVDPINILTRYGGELVLGGTSGNDSIYVAQSGSTLTIVANGYTSTAAAPANGLFIYSFGGADTITVDASVTLRLTIAAIDGAGTSVSNADTNADVWIDSTDGFSGAGALHRVASFYQNVSKAMGINIAEPTDAGTTFRASASLWGAGPVAADVNQGGIGDCYFLASLAAFANSCPAKLQSMAVDLGDGTYAVQYLRSGVASFVRVDGDISSGPYWGYSYAHPGASGDLWALIMEKSYAYFRSGANTYSSLSSGWMGAVYSDFGIANTSVGLSTTDAALYSTLSNALAAGKPVTMATYSSGTTLVSSHAYTVISVMSVGGVNYYTVRNPWGMSGDSLENSAGYATLTFAQMQANFQLGTMAT
jgi:hypothetical protein